MKKLTIIFVYILVFSLMADFTYSMSLKFYVDGNEVDGNEVPTIFLNETLQLDVYFSREGTELSELNAVEFVLLFDKDKLSVDDAWVNDVPHGGPWNPYPISKVECTSGSCLLEAAVKQFECFILEGDKVLLGSFVFRCIEGDNSQINTQGGDAYDCFDEEYPLINTSTIIKACGISINPPSPPIVKPLVCKQFNPIQSENCESPNFKWQVTESCGSTIDSNGLYCAGNVIDDCTDTITLTDEANKNIKNTATVHIDAECILHIEPKNPPPVKIGETIQFKPIESGCEEPCYTWSVSAEGATGNSGNTGGNTIEASPMYYTWSVSAAGTTGNTGNTIFANGRYVCRVAETDLVKVTDACNNISDTAVVVCESTTTTTIPGKLCTSSTECNDGLFCNGLERCAGGRCKPGSYPCPDDGLFCTGKEGCDEAKNVCTQSGDPCAPQLICIEEDAVCVGCLNNAECDDELFCNGEERCDEEGVCQPGSNSCPDDGLFCTGIEGCSEEQDICINSDPCEEGESCDEAKNECSPVVPPILNFDIIPTEAFRSHFIPLPLFMFLVSADEDTQFDFGATNVTSTDVLTPPWTLVLSQQLIFAFSLVTPAGLEAADEIQVPITVAVGEREGIGNLTLHTLEILGIPLDVE